MPPTGRDLYVRADRLRRVLDDGNAGAGGDVEDRIHVGAQAEQVHRHDRLVRGVMAAATAAGSMLKVDRIDVHEHRPRAEARDGAGRREERVRRRDDLVAGPMSSAISASSSASVPDDTAIGVRDAEHRAPARSRAPSISGPMMKRWLSQTRVDRRENLVAQRAVLRLQIEQRNLQRHAGDYSTCRVDL